MARQELIGQVDDPLIAELIMGVDHFVTADGLLPAANRSKIGVPGDVVLIFILGPIECKKRPEDVVMLPVGEARDQKEAFRLRLGALP